MRVASILIVLSFAAPAHAGDLLVRRVWSAVDAPEAKADAALAALGETPGATWQAVLDVLRAGRSFKLARGHQAVEEAQPLRVCWRTAGWERNTVRRYDLGAIPGCWYALDVPSGPPHKNGIPVLITLGAAPVLGHKPPHWAVVRLNWGIAAVMEADGFTISMTAGRTFQSWLLSVVADLERRFPVDRDRVVITGYSRGGNSTWYHATHWPDLWAGAAPAAGYYPAMKPLSDNLRSLSLLVGAGKDRMHKGANDWSRRIAGQLRSKHRVTLHRSKRRAVDDGWAQAFWTWAETQRRDPMPDTVRYERVDPVHREAFWVEILETARSGGLRSVVIRRPGGAGGEVFQVHRKPTSVLAERIAANHIRVRATNVKRLRIWLSPDHHDLKRPVTIQLQGKQVTHTPRPAIDALIRHMREHGDARRVCPAYAEVEP